MSEEMTLERLEQIAKTAVAHSPSLAMVVGKPREDTRGGMGLFEASMGSGAGSEDKVTLHVTYRDGKVVSKNFTSVKAAQEWGDKNHPDGSALIRQPTTSDGTRHEKGGKFFGKLVSQREGTGKHAKWVTEQLAYVSAPMDEAATIVRDGIYLGQGMGEGLWYIQKFQSTPEVLYFRCEGTQKNGNYTGTMVEVDPTRPRAKPKKKKISVTKMDAKSLWNNIEMGQVPDAVRSMAGDSSGKKSESSALERAGVAALVGEAKPRS